MKKTTTKPNPVFYADQLELALGAEHPRVDGITHERDSVDLLTWNVFAALDTDTDREYLAGVMRPLCGNDLRAPVRLSLWTGRDRAPKLEPSRAYVRHLEQTTEGTIDRQTVTQPIEVPVRIEASNVLGFAEVTQGALPGGTAGRDRLIELLDAGIVHAHRLGKALSVAVVYRHGTPEASELSARINQLRRPDELRAAMPWVTTFPDIRLRELSLQQLAQTWERERKHLRLHGQPAKAFSAHIRQLGLR